MTADTVNLRAIRKLKPVARVLAEPLLDLLEGNVAPAADRLTDTLAIIETDESVDSERLLILAKSKVKDLWSTDTGAAIVWFREWLRLEPGKAWAFFEKKIKIHSASELAVVRLLLHRIKPDIEKVNEGIDCYLRNPRLLGRIIPATHRFFPVQDDPQDDEGFGAGGGENSPYEIRNRLTRLLEGIEGADAHKVLCEMANHPDLSAICASLEAAVERHAGKAIEPCLWAPKDLVEFANAYERDPATADELFCIVDYRLEEIKYDFENGDFGDRGIFTDGIDEQFVQRYFAGRLDRESRQRYAITREEEVAERKEPDIRARHSRAGVVSIEIKPLDSKRYSLKALKKTIATQLVGQYMRAANSNHGILLLCMVKKRTWRPKELGRTIELEELVAILNSECEGIVENSADIAGLKVVGIDASIQRA